LYQNLSELDGYCKIVVHGWVVHFLKHRLAMYSSIESVPVTLLAVLAVFVVLWAADENNRWLFNTFRHWLRQISGCQTSHAVYCVLISLNQQR